MLGFTTSKAIRCCTLQLAFELQTHHVLLIFVLICWQVINLSIAAYVSSEEDDAGDTLRIVCQVFKEASDAGAVSRNDLMLRCLTGSCFSPACGCMLGACNNRTQASMSEPQTL
jgi:hypothetical protein